jgi:hypothetical protein
LGLPRGGGVIAVVLWAVRHPSGHVDMFFGCVSRALVGQRQSCHNHRWGKSGMKAGESWHWAIFLAQLTLWCVQIAPYIEQIDSVQFLTFFLLNHHIGMSSNVMQDYNTLDGGFNSLTNVHETDTDRNV